jgi:hypothetical protein
MKYKNITNVRKVPKSNHKIVRGKLVIPKTYTWPLSMWTKNQNNHQCRIGITCLNLRCEDRVCFFTDTGLSGSGEDGGVSVLAPDPIFYLLNPVTRKIYKIFNQL